MHTNLADRLDATFLALADPTRRAMLARLTRGEASVAELARPFDISQPAISKHLKILERAGLVTVGQDAQRRPRRLAVKPLAEASAWLECYRDTWEVNFQRLDGVLEELQAGTTTARSAPASTSTPAPKRAPKRPATRVPRQTRKRAKR